MIIKFKNFIVLLISFIILSDFSNLIAESSFDSTLQSLIEEKQKCLKSKSNNFTDNRPKDRIILLYLNGILDKILDSNKPILDALKRSKSEFCIAIDQFANFLPEGIGGFQSTVSGLIKISISKSFKDYNPFINDTYIASQLSHEIAHDLLKHFDTHYNTLIKIEEEYSKLSEDEKQKISFENYYISHPVFLKESREQEITADTLALRLYLNAGFSSYSFGDFFLHAHFILFPPEDFLTVEEAFESTQKHLQNKDPQVRGPLDQIMSTDISVKYHNEKLDTHPRELWRSWYAYRLSEELLATNEITATNNDIIDTAYFKIDLTNYKKLETIKSLLNKKERFLFINYQNTQNPILFILQEILNANSEITYTLELNSTNRDDINYIKEDNSIVLKAHDVFLILLKDLIPYNKSNSCTFFFNF